MRPERAFCRHDFLCQTTGRQFFTDGFCGREGLECTLNVQELEMTIFGEGNDFSSSSGSESDSDGTTSRTYDLFRVS
jgi:hypothetical protein